MDYFSMDGMTEAELRAERDKARVLRKSRWWQRKTAAGLCHYCAQKFSFKQLTMDHLVPLARGGRSTRDNLVPACKDCNNRKKTMMPLEWEAYLEKIQKQ